MSKKITISTESYNEKRFGRPWIAKVEFWFKSTGEFEFGQWDGRPGERGELSIEVEPGDIVARGQKDSRKNSIPDYFIVLLDCSLFPVKDKNEASRISKKDKDDSAKKFTQEKMDQLMSSDAELRFRLKNGYCETCYSQRNGEIIKDTDEIRARVEASFAKNCEQIEKLSAFLR